MELDRSKISKMFLPLNQATYENFVVIVFGEEVYLVPYRAGGWAHRVPISPKLCAREIGQGKLLTSCLATKILDILTLPPRKPDDAMEPRHTCQ